MNLRKLLFKSLGTGLNAYSYLSPKKAGDLTFKVFASPPTPRIRPKEKDFLDTAERLDFKYEGKNIPVYAWGPADGPVVFCAYGWGYNAGRWRHYVPALVEAGKRVVAFDPIGHGNADKGTLHFPAMVGIERAILKMTDGCELALVHSFGGGCLVEALIGLPQKYHPKRMCVLAVLSEVKWLFLVFAKTLGLRPVVFRELENHIKGLTGRRLEDFDIAASTQQLAHVQALIIHDPKDTVTTFRNSERNHSYWPGSALYRSNGGGHNLGTPEITHNVLDFLLNGTLPEGVTVNRGDLQPLPAIVTQEDLIVSGGVSDYYT
ncbi:alpha/beta fold hydrolase [Neolewinella antarctica]|uniref:Pimeloyl-ACP methyl ester carboxylesterase n=1 Tax=Neolewinella antarctica TaxID=442734 RepID=A0ABX0XDG7_9BACT|nr:alpha/beta hydrolase [Neolewinella antarctica]NJC27354.1 pimeloyl-ACP methyl ester carboxylesterase [Neolewinella antarctica]